MKLPIYDQLNNEILQCTKCGLGENILEGYDPHVVGQGNLDAKIMFIAEAPGFQETVHKRPLTPPGRSGKVYEMVLAQIGLKREDVYTTNIVACRPPKNRDPDAHEIYICKTFFKRQLELVKPQLVVTFGRFAAQALLGHVKITNDRGKIQTSQVFGVDVFPMYHPAYIAAYAPAEKRIDFNKDIKRLKEIIKGYL
jgi:DNA polymerase